MIYFRAFADTIKDNSAVFTFILGYAVYKLSKKTYDSNNAPAIFPISFNSKQHNITIVNNGKGVAQNIRLEAYTHFIEFARSKPIEWKLSFETISFLPPGETIAVKVKEKEKNEILFTYLFGKYSENRTPFSAIYKNLDGQRYKTSVIVTQGKFTFVKFGTYSAEAHIIREIFEFVNFFRVKSLVYAKFILKKLKKKSSATQSSVR